jgi:hypothetical protein
MSDKKSARPNLKPGQCSVCHHPSLREIDQALINGASLRPLAALYGLSTSALSRHTKHLRRHLEYQDRQDQKAQLTADLDELDLLRVRLDRLYSKSDSSQSLHISLGCIQEYLRLISLRAKIRHSLKGVF